MIYIVTGKLGAGKSLLAVQKMIDYAADGRKIAANFPVDFGPACRSLDSKISKSHLTVLPSLPSSKDLEGLGIGGQFEDTAGALVLDECAQFLNSRQWQGEDRQNIINWLLHARKRKWDVFLIVQHERMLDKQVRDALAEYVVTIKRTDRLQVPFIKVKLPRFHIGTVRYGLDSNAMIADHWITRGTEPMKCYDTAAIFEEEMPAYCTLPHATIEKWYSKQLVPVWTAYNLAMLLPRITLYLAVRALAPMYLDFIQNKKGELASA